jgi:hypothetical protein
LVPRLHAAKIKDTAPSKMAHTKGLAPVGLDGRG